MKIFKRKEIEEAISIPDVLAAIENGFMAYSQGVAVIPPMGALHFNNGDCHIKFGYTEKSKYYVVKIASGFYDNPKHGLPSNNGMMLLFDKETGAPVCTLLDEGYLTDVRTGIAGCIAAKYVAPKDVSCIGIVGTGSQSYYQLKYLELATSCRSAMVFGRDKEKKAHKFTALFGGWSIHVADSIVELTSACNLIVTTTASREPLLFAEQIKPGTHITAVGADDIGKQELDPEIFAKADRVIVDSRTQCTAVGDTSYALKEDLINSEKLVELGEVLKNPKLGRTDDSQITICDLTGIAIQDLAIAESVYKTLDLERLTN